MMHDNVKIMKVTVPQQVTRSLDGLDRLVSHSERIEALVKLSKHGAHCDWLRVWESV